MKIEHIAINIEEEVEIADFYIGVLGMSKLKNFTISRALSEQIFKIKKEASVFLLQKAEVIFEIFVSKPSSINNFQHICISCNNRDDLYSKALQKGYIEKVEGKSRAIKVKEKAFTWYKEQQEQISLL